MNVLQKSSGTGCSLPDGRVAFESIERRNVQGLQRAALASLTQLWCQSCSSAKNCLLVAALFQPDRCKREPLLRHWWKPVASSPQSVFGSQPQAGRLVAAEAASLVVVNFSLSSRVHVL